MSFWNRALVLLDRLNAPRVAAAHCDVPCGIYNPIPAQIAAETVVTMVQKMQALTPPPPDADLATRQQYENTVGRMIATKEIHAELVKREVQILWSDYFKPQHLEMFPDLHDFVWKTLKQASSCKQNADIDAARKLHEKVHQIGDWFYQSKAEQQPQIQTEKTQPVTQAPVR